MLLRDLGALGDGVVGLVTADGEGDAAAEEGEGAEDGKPGAGKGAATGRILLLTEAFAINDRLRKGAPLRRHGVRTGLALSPGAMPVTRA